jgi:hypothetical protein
MLAKKGSSLYRRRRALVFISSLFSRMVTERIAQVCSTRCKGQAGVLDITYRLRHLPKCHFFQVGRRRSSEQLPCERSSSLENDKGLESPPALEAQLLFFELVRYPRLAQSLADCAMDKEEHRVDKDDSLALLRSTYAKFLAPELLQRGCRRSS